MGGRVRRRLKKGAFHSGGCPTHTLGKSKMGYAYTQAPSCASSFVPKMRNARVTNFWDVRGSVSRETNSNGKEGGTGGKKRLRDRS